MHQAEARQSSRGLGSMRIRRYFVVCLAFACWDASLLAQTNSRAPLTGFAASRVGWEMAYEARLQKLVSPAREREFLRFLTSVPHPAGSEGDKKISQYIFERFQEFGLKPEMVEYEVLLSYPVRTTVEIIGPEPVKLARPEVAYPDDPDTLVEDIFTRIPWNAYSPSADLTLPVVYANFGRAEDYEELARQGVEVKGKIVLARYFKGYRGGKSLEAEKRGVAALLLYSDPMEDGYFQGDTYPKGPWGPAEHFQRGANVYDFLIPGDPLTPGWASTADSKRIAESEATILPRIPMIPLSSRDAAEIFARLDGQVVPKGWQGALPLTYHLGENLRIHFATEMKRVRTKIWNVVGTIEGTEEPEKFVLLSNHHDAWVYGAVDPSSGTASMLELGRALGELAREGWRPRRSIVFGSWDAEEYTLTGSTEWGEQFADRIRQNAIACLNVDASTSGDKFAASASPLLRSLIWEATQAVEDPIHRVPVYQRWHEAGRRESVRSYAVSSGAGNASRPEIQILGSGSDYTVFFNHLGIPSLDMIFDGPYGVYHSVYDNFYWMSHFGDPTFDYHAAMSRLWGVMAIRLANADILPFDLSAYADDLVGYADSLKERASKEFAARHLDGIAAEARKLKQAAAAAEKRIRKILARPDAIGASLPVGQAGSPGQESLLRKLREEMRRLEQNLLSQDGLPGRPWFKHMVYAPLPSYEAETLPGVREALLAKDEGQAAAQALLLRRAIRSMTARMQALGK